MTNVLFHALNRKSHFQHHPSTAYPIIIVLSVLVLYIAPHRMTINQYLTIYFLHMALLRRNPSIFNVTNGQSFIASDYKCHLFAAAFGWICAVIISLWTRDSIFSLQFVYNMVPTLTVILSDGYYGQYAVHQRIQRNMKEREKREQQKEKEQKQSTDCRNLSM